MAIDHRTYPWASRISVGSLRLKALYNNTFGYTETRKEVAAASSTAVLGATNGAATAQTITSGITNPDVPRALSLTPTANTTGSPLTVPVTGKNVEGKTIVQNFIIPANSTSILNGTMAFKSIDSVGIPANTVGLTITIGTLNALGINHRLFRNNTTVKVYSYTAAGEPGGMPTTLTLQGAPTVVANGADVEFNLVTPATTPDGTTAYTIAYAYDNWAIAPLNDEPEYSTTTSTSSTSTSTSTTTITTSTSSTSVSTSSTSTSSTSSSTSTSSTSTSTTTAP